MFAVTEDAIDIAEVRKAAADPEAGAVIVFVGTVRAHTHGKEVLHLDYEAYAPMATATFEQLAAQARERFSALRVAIVHRIGRLQIGEAAVVIAVSAAHREKTYEASRYLIEAVKHEAPVWKKEVMADGSRWVACCA